MMYQIKAVRRLATFAFHTIVTNARFYGSLLGRVAVLAVIGVGTANMLSQIGPLFVVGGTNDAAAIVLVRLPSLTTVSVDVTMLARDVLAFFAS